MYLDKIEAKHAPTQSASAASFLSVRGPEA